MNRVSKPILRLILIELDVINLDIKLLRMQSKSWNGIVLH
jgi:hypothetical protein